MYLIFWRNACWQNAFLKQIKSYIRKILYQQITTKLTSDNKRNNKCQFCAMYYLPHK